MGAGQGAGLGAGQGAGQYIKPFQRFSTTLCLILLENPLVVEGTNKQANKHKQTQTQTHTHTHLPLCQTVEKLFL